MTLRHERLRAHGWGPLREVDLDLAAMPGIAAIAGPNGAGKSTLLELILGAMYRECPSRGGLSKIASIKGATLELQSRNGQAIVARHVVDATTKSPRQEAVLVVDGAPTSGKVKDFDEAARSVYPPLEFYLASAFSAQGGAGAFADLSKDERRQVLQRLLGLERLQTMADAARDRRKALQAEVVTLEARIADLQGGDLALLERRQAEIKAEAETDAKYLGELRERLARVNQDLAEAAAAEKAVEERRKVWESQRYRIGRLQDAIEHAQAAVGRCQRAAAALPDMEQALASVAQRLATIRELEPQVAEAKLQKEQAAREGSENWTTLKRAEKELEGLQGIIGRADAIRDAAALVLKCEGAAAEAEGDLAEAEAVLLSARERAVSHREAVVEAERICLKLGHAERASSLLGEVPCGGQGTFAGCALLGDATRARDTVAGLREDLVRVAWEGFDLSAPSLLLSAENKLGAARSRLSAIQDELRTARASAVDAPRLQDAEPRAEALRVEIEERSARHEILIAARDRYAAHATRVGLELENTRKAIAVQAPGGEQQLRDSIASARAEAEKLEDEQGRLASLEQDLAAEVLGEEPTVESAAAARREASRRYNEVLTEEGRVQARVPEHARALATTEEQIRQARASGDQRTELSTKAEGLRQDVADWTLVERGFGKDGIQALLVDAAGPAISALCNQLLEVTFGARFRVSLETTRLDSTGKRLIETLDLRVIDSERGREGSVETLSGGERVVVGLALRLALCLHHGAGMGFEQLFLDEMDGALDGENAERFVPMLRRSMALGGLTQIVFVSHREACQVAADHVIEVRDGRVEVKS